MCLRQAIWEVVGFVVILALFYPLSFSPVHQDVDNVYEFTVELLGKEVASASSPILAAFVFSSLLTRYMEVSFQSEYKMVRGGSAVLQIVTLGACLMLSVLVYQNSLYSFVLGSLTLALAFLFYMFGFQESAEKERRSTEELRAESQ